jgi:MinD superfamily P-loop ATPase
MIVAIASGKGGTGKTTVAVNLAKIIRSRVLLLDCDVEEPNCHLFLKGVPRSHEPVTASVPKVDESLCDACGECARFCEYNAIVSLKTKPLIFPELCHSCGGCARICPHNAISETSRRIGVVEVLDSENLTIIQGCLDVSVAMSPPVIRAVKRCLQERLPAILDAPPGSSCPVIATLRGTHFVVLVTEPTPFGLHDLSLAVDMVRELRIPCGVVVNRMGIGDNRVHDFCSRENVPLLMEIPDDRRIAEAYSRGDIIVDALPEYRSLFEALWERIVRETNNVQGIVYAHL